jgi:hypothetical protein
MSTKIFKCLPYVYPVTFTQQKSPYLRSFQTFFSDPAGTTNNLLIFFQKHQFSFIIKGFGKVCKNNHIKEKHQNIENVSHNVSHTFIFSLL